MSDTGSQKTDGPSSIPFALLGGFAACLIGAAIWAVITVLAEYQTGLMAIVVGLLVGFSVRYFGQGTRPVFGVIGASFALVGCVLGNVFTQIGFFSAEAGLSLFRSVTAINYPLLVRFLVENGDPIDLLFFGIAIFEGYRFTVGKKKGVDASQEVSAPGQWESPRVPSYPRNKLLYISGVYGLLILLVLVFGVSNASPATYYYPSGSRHYSGREVFGVADGLWTYWHEDGSLQAEIAFVDGFEDGPYTSYYPNGQLFIENTYFHGMKHDAYTEYFENGQVAVAGAYQYDRMTGEWSYYNLDGSLYQRGSYYLDLPHGEWFTFRPDGTVVETGSYTLGVKTGSWTYFNESGVLTLEEDHSAGNPIRIVTQLGPDGDVLVKSGNGEITALHANGRPAITGRVQNGYYDGSWKEWFENGSPKSEIEYRNGQAYVSNMWAADGSQTVSSGKGTVREYYPNGQLFAEFRYVGGRLSGPYHLFHEDGQVSLETQHVDGNLHGGFVQHGQTGVEIVRGDYANGERHGLWEWSEEHDGSLSSSVTFDNGKKEGVQRFWKNGEEVKNEIYSNGELIETRLLF